MTQQNAMHFTSLLAVVQCIVMSMFLGVPLCVYVCLSTNIPQKQHGQSSQKTAQKYCLYWSHLLKSPLNGFVPNLAQLKGSSTVIICVNFLGDQLIMGFDSVWVEFCHFTLTNPVAINTMLAQPSSTWWRRKLLYFKTIPRRNPDTL